MEKRYFGITIIKSENSNWNADFSGAPRRLPDEKGTVYATDKALKYAMRKYWNDTGENVFVWKSFIETENSKTKEVKLIPRKLNERFEFMQGKLEIDDKNKHYKVFLKCIDTRLFGITYAGEINLALTGPAQISYGVNRLEESIIFSNQILSPYRTEGKDEKEKDSSTLGSETKALESYYVYDFSINPKNLTDHLEDFMANTADELENIEITSQDIDKFKEAINKAATNLNTASKIGSENVFSLFISVEGNLQIPSLKKLVTVTKENDKVEIDISKIKEILSTYQNKIEVELFKSPIVSVNQGDNNKWEEKNIME